MIPAVAGETVNDFELYIKGDFFSIIELRTMTDIQNSGTLNKIQVGVRVMCKEVAASVRVICEGFNTVQPDISIVSMH